MSVNFRAKPICIAIALVAAAVFAAAAPRCAVAAVSPAELDKQIKKQEKQYKNLQNQMSSNNKKLSETKQKEKNVVNELESLSKKMTVTQQKVDVVTTHIKKVEHNIQDLTQQIIVTNKQIFEAESYLSKRYVAIYKYGGVAEFNLLLSSQGATDALANSYLLSKIVNQDKKVINGLMDSKKKLTAAHVALREQRGELKSKSTELKQQHKQLKTVTNDRTQLLSRVRRDKALYIAQQNEFAEAARELQSAVKRMLAQKRELLKKRSPGKKATVYYKGGRLAWPVRGEISSGFGTRVHPVFHTRSNHQGIDIRAPRGTPIGAADAGEVLYTGWMRGYGQVVIIDHGADLTTVYGHMSKIECSEGQKVARGTVIGRVGSTGIATGNHVHFEVRVDGNAVNPMGYLR